MVTCLRLGHAGRARSLTAVAVRVFLAAYA